MLRPDQVRGSIFPNHYPLSENRDFSTTEHLVVLKPVFIPIRPGVLDPMGEKQTKSCWNPKTYLTKSVCSAHITIKKLYPFVFVLFRGAETCFLTPLEGKATKKVLEPKNLFS